MQDTGNKSPEILSSVPKDKHRRVKGWPWSGLHMALTMDFAVGNSDVEGNFGFRVAIDWTYEWQICEVQHWVAVTMDCCCLSPNDHYKVILRSQTIRPQIPAF